MGSDERAVRAVSDRPSGEDGHEAVLSAAGTLSGHVGDVYSVCFHPREDQLVTSGDWPELGWAGLG